MLFVGGPLHGLEWDDIVPGRAPSEVLLLEMNLPTGRVECAYESTCWFTRPGRPLVRYYALAGLPAERRTELASAVLPC